MTQPWELNDPVPENDYDRSRRRRKQFGTTAIALLVVVGLLGSTVLALF